MQEIQKTIQSFLDNHQRKQKYIFILIVLSLLVVLFVTISLIMPAVSETGTLSCNIEAHTHDSSCYDENGNLICGLDEHIHSEECYFTGDDFFNNDYIQLGMSSNNILKGFSLVKKNDVPTTIDFTMSDTNIAGLSAGATGTPGLNETEAVLTLKYHLDKEVFSDNMGMSTSSSVNEDKIVKYQLPDTIISHLSLPINGTNENEFTDSANGNLYSKSAGKFYITYKGVVYITFYKDYLNAVKTKLLESGGDGDLKFEATAIRDKNDVNDANLSVGEYKATIPFSSKNVTLQKSGSFNKDTNSFKWKITINNPYGVNLSDSTYKYYISDNMLSKSTFCESSTSLGIIEDGKFKFIADTSSMDRIELEYETPMAMVTNTNGDAISINESGSVRNIASLNSNGDEISSNTGIANYTRVNLVKSGKPENGKMKWTINLQNPTGFNLSDYIIDDEVSLNGATVTYSDNTTETINIEDFTIPSEHGKDNNINITYTIDINPSNPFSSGVMTNSAKLKDSTSSDTGISVIENATYKGITISKSGSQVDNDGNITWTITINNDSGFNLNGYAITDSMFSNIDGIVTTSPDGVGSLENGTFNFSNSENSITSSNITITYKTKLSDITTISPSGGSVDNTATISNGTNSKDSNKATVEYSGVTLNKSASSLNSDSTGITWTITINNPNNIDLKDYVIKDSMFQYASTDLSQYGTLSSDKTELTLNGSISTITYTTPFSSLPNTDDYSQNTGGKVTNQATISKDSFSQPSNDVEVYVSGKFGITKNGYFDYDYSNTDYTSYHGTNEKIVWVIHLNANYGKTLNCCTVQDDAFKGKNLSDLNFSDSSVSASASLDSDTGILTISSDITSLDIVYTTDYSDSNKNNTATLGKEDYSNPCYSSVSGNYEPYDISKSNSIVDKKVIWTITITKKDGANSLNGFKVEDSMLSKAIENTIEVVEPSGATFTDGTIGGVDDNINRVVIKYQTNPKSYSNYNDLTDEEKEAIKNTAHLKDSNGKEWDSAESNQVPYTPVNKITKSKVSDETNNKTGGIIDWKVIYNRDDGFNNSSISITDNMTVSNSDALHYMTKSQAEAITISGSNSSQDYQSDDKYTTIDSSKYIITYYNGDTEISTLSDDSQITKFIITFDDSIGEEILSVKVNYSTSANIDNVQAGEKVTFTNTADGYQTTSNSTHDITKFNPNDRPFTKYALDTNNNLLDETCPTRSLSQLDTQTIDGEKYYIFTWAIHTKCSGYEPPFTLKDTLPEGFTLYEDGEYAPKRLIFWNNGAYKIPADNEIYIKNDDGSSYSINGSNVTFEIKDTSINCYIKYSAKIKASELESRFGDDTNKVTISNYVAMPSEADFTQTQNQTITQDSGDMGDSIYDGTILNKTVDSHTTNSSDHLTKRFDYSIEVNPNAVQLSNDGTLVLNDNFFINSCIAGGNPVSDISKFNIDENSINLAVYEIDDDGNIVRKLENSEYSYIVSDPKTNYSPIDTTLTGTIPTGKDDTVYINENNHYYRQRFNFGIKGVNGGDKIRISNINVDKSVIEKKSLDLNTILENISICLRPYGDGYGTYISVQNLYKEINDDGSLNLTFTIPENINPSGYYLEVSENSNIWIGSDDELIYEGITYKGVTYEGLLVNKNSCVVGKGIDDEFTKNLQISLPDKMHLRVDYFYNIINPDIKVDETTTYLGNVKLQNGDTISTSNKVSINTGNYWSVSSREATAKLYDRLESNFTTTELPKIKKYDVGDYTIGHLGGAEFQIAKWDNGQWVYASKMVDYHEDDDDTKKVLGKKVEDWTGASTTATIITTENEDYKIKLDDGTIYALIEVKPPNGYNKLKEPIYFTYNTGLLDSVSATKIDSTTQLKATDITDVSEKGTLKVPNSRNITVNAEKHWSDMSTNSHTSDEVVVQLFSSTTKTITGFPSDLTPVKNNGSNYTLPLDNSNNWKNTFTNLPNGDEKGNTLYYYVKEISYKIDGTEYQVTDSGGLYTPYYTGNAISIDSTVTILNSNNFEIQKVWYDVDGDDISNLIDNTISVNIYQTADGVKELYNTVELSKSNNWKYVATNLPLRDTNGNAYSYTVEEVDVPEGYTVNYLYNRNGNTGTAKIVNKSNEVAPGKFKLQVRKVWLDGSSQHTNDNITVNIYRKLENSSGDGVLYDTVILNGTNVWKTSIKVDEEDENGNKYIYYVKESTENDGTITIGDKSYKVSYDNNSVSCDTEDSSIVITNTPSDYKDINITVNKVWSGDWEGKSDGDTYPKNISSINVELWSTTSDDCTENVTLEKSLTLNEGNNWSATVNDLPNYLRYYIVEKISSSDAECWKVSYSYSGNCAKFPDNITITVTNTYEEPTTLDLKVRKTWDDLGNTVTHEPVQFVVCRSTNLDDVGKDIASIPTGGGSSFGTDATIDSNYIPIALEEGKTIKNLIINVDTSQATGNLYIHFSPDKNISSPNWQVSFKDIKFFYDSNNKVLQNSQNSGGFEYNIDDNTITIQVNSSSFNTLLMNVEGGTFKINYTLVYEDESSTPEVDPNVDDELDCSVEGALAFTNDTNTTTIEVSTPISVQSAKSLTNLPRKNGDDYYYYWIKEIPVTNYDTTYRYSNPSNYIYKGDGNINITNTVHSGKLNITKRWSGEPNLNSVSVDIYRTINLGDVITSATDGVENTPQTWTSQFENEKLVESYEFTEIGKCYDSLSQTDISKILIDFTGGITSNGSIGVFGENDNWQKFNNDNSTPLTFNGTIPDKITKIQLYYYGFNSDENGKILNPVYVKLYKNEDLVIKSDSQNVLVGGTLNLNPTWTDTSLKVKYSSSDDKIAIVDINTGVVTGVSTGDVTITATIKDASDNEITSIICDLKVVEPSKVEVNTGNLTPIKRVTLTSSENWQTTIDNLPIDDGNGNPYYYYIKEVDGNYTPIKYENQGTELAYDDDNSQPEVKEMGVTNLAKSTEDLIVLPSTGGLGTMKYYVIGGGIVAISTIMLVKRRRDFKG